MIEGLTLSDSTTKPQKLAPEHPAVQPGYGQEGSGPHNKTARRKEERRMHTTSTPINGRLAQAWGVTKYALPRQVQIRRRCPAMELCRIRSSPHSTR